MYRLLEEVHRACYVKLSGATVVLSAILLRVKSLGEKSMTGCVRRQVLQLTKCFKDRLPGTISQANAN